MEMGDEGTKTPFFDANYGTSASVYVLFFVHQSKYNERK